jgi:pimeloyl-ACP methyl ester carboxylesterase
MDQAPSTRPGTIGKAPSRCIRSWQTAAMRKVATVVGRAIAVVLLLAAVLVVWQWKRDLPLDQLQARWGNGASRFVDVDGMSVHYRDEGSGPPIVLIHGTGASLHTWDAWTAALSGTHRVVRFDLPGFGLTGPNPDGDYRIDTYVDFVEHVTTRLGLDRFALAGNSLGGQIAWRFAVRHPADVRALVLVDAAGYPRSVRPPLVFRLGSVPVVSSLMGHLDPRMLVKSTLKKTYGDPARITPDLVERYYELALRPGNRAAFGARTALPFEDRTAQLRDLNVPTLILWGAKDRLIPVSDAQRFATDIHGATLHVFDDLGHVPMEEDGAGTVAVARAFLEDSHSPLPAQETGL